jgi:riboflavin kinase / FMN adenylyltransferase
MFGARRSGNVSLLQKLGGELGFTLRALRDVELDGQSVSSTRIRDAVRSGDFALAGRMLGRPYSLCGTVIKGEQLGRKLGFPTANLDVTGLLVPPTGVYAAEAQIGAARHRAAVNIGHRPTVRSADPQLHVEAHLLGFDKDIYGQILEVVFLKKLRNEKKFPTPESRAVFLNKVCLSPVFWAYSSFLTMNTGISAINDEVQGQRFCASAF